MIDLVANFGRFLLHVFGGIDLPALVLLAMLVALGVAMWKAQQRQDFDWGEGFRDANNKISFVRMGVLVCIGVSSWLLIYLTMTTINAGDAPTIEALNAVFKFYVTYMAFWSGTKIAERVVEIVAAKVFGVAMPPEPAPKPAGALQ